MGGSGSVGGRVGGGGRSNVSEHTAHSLVSERCSRSVDGLGPRVDPLFSSLADLAPGLPRDLSRNSELGRG